MPYRFESGHRHHRYSGAIKYRGVEQLVARRAHNPEVGGSSPPSATNKKNRKTIVFSGFVVLFSLFAEYAKALQRF